jgi:hypothetical protein
VDKCIKQCCGTGTAGTVTFCHSGTGTRMHYSSGFGSRFRSGSNIKWNKKVIKYERPNYAVSDIEKARFGTILLLLKIVQNFA